MSDLSFNVNIEIQDFILKKSEWDHFQEKCHDTTFFSSWEWHYAYWKSKIESNEEVSVNIFYFYSDSELIGIIPLKICQEVVSLLTYPTADYQSVLVKEKDLITDIINIIISVHKGKKIVFGDIVKSTCSYIELLKVPGSSIEVGEGAPFIKMESQDFQNAINIHQTRIKRCLKKSSTIGTIKFDKIMDRVQIKNEIPNIKKFYRDRWFNDKSSWFFFTDFDNCLFRNLADVSCGKVILFKLSISTVSIAYEFGILYKSKFYSIRSAFNEEYNFLSPGVLMINTVLKYLKTLEIDEYDFLRGMYKHKLEYTSKARQNINFVFN